MNNITFLDDNGTFKINKPENTSYLYFPLASEAGLKSAITPNLAGDAKLDQETFLLEPVSAENLHNNRLTRNFFVADDAGNVFCAAGTSAEQEINKFTDRQEESELTAGLMWHTIKRTAGNMPITATVTTFVPVKHNVEVMLVTIENNSDEELKINAYASMPIYGRSADNIRDHRNVTSMLHRIRTTEDSVMVRPTMSFDEKGHRVNEKIYYACGWDGNGNGPESFYPTIETYVGEGGSYTRPRSIYDKTPGVPSGNSFEGREAMGAFRFREASILPKGKAEYVVLLGVEDSEADAETVKSQYSNAEIVKADLEATKKYWAEKVNISFHSGDDELDGLMRWVSFQPFLRRLFGCSFLPHHDYGRGGRGWRDLWQDCLSLLLMDPGDVGTMIEKNYGGVRIDGTNATIIGAGDGNFIADRNGIARVWMDHALWPLMTTKLYIDQTGDVNILNKEAAYFKDPQTLRGTAVDEKWTPEYGSCQRTADGTVYKGSILEHIIIQHLASFYEVGAHNIYRLRGADWNDALDMAADNGESVAFTFAYAGNLKSLADMIELFEVKCGVHETELLKEAEVLFNESVEVFASVEAKSEILKAYCEACRHNISGEKMTVSLAAVAADLRVKADWLMEHLRGQEWIEGETEGWYNSYYDNSGRRVEGYFDESVRMMLTGQVFAIMSGTATDDEIGKIVKAANHYLFKEDVGGYRLNTDFNELKFDMGRMFGFAYGEKENGAVFCHMTTMFGNALYRRGFAKEGWKALNTLAKTALDFDTSRIYPGIPEYFRADGRGMYHYLTGCASWYLMTMVTESYGVRGEAGDLVLAPRLLKEQFDADGTSSVTLPFAGKVLKVTYVNPAHKEFGEYKVAGVKIAGHTPGAGCCDVSAAGAASVRIPRDHILALGEGVNEIVVELR